MEYTKGEKKMALYRVTQKEIETTERIYEVDASNEKEALENYAIDKRDKVFPQQVKTIKHTELVLEQDIEATK